jgi:hypothetical protein
LNSPNGGEQLEIGRVETITWTELGVQRIRLEYYFDNGGTWHDINIVDAVSGKYQWALPLVESESCLVRISDNDNPGRSDTGDGVFTIRKTQWITYSTANGLVSNDINALAVDNNGVLWFGSRDNGISRFNGISWQTYNTSNSRIVSNDFLWIEQDREGKMWFGSTWNGVSCYDGNNWVNYTQVANVRGIAVDFNNVKWFGEYSNGLSSFDGLRWTKYTAPGGPLSNDCEVVMFDNNDNSIWVGYGESAFVGVSHFDGKIWKHYSSQNGLVNNFVSAMVVDKDGVRWFGTNGGVSSFDGNTWKNYTGITNYPIKTAAVDMNNVKWFGTSGGGVISFDGKTWKTYTTLNSGICSDNIVRTLADKNGVWFASRTNGVSFYNVETGPYISLSSPNGGEIWEAGSAHAITWTSKDVEKIRIEFSSDNGATWTVIADNEDASANTFSWTLPTIQSFTCKIRLTDTSDSGNTDKSNGVFSISPPFVQVISPNGGEKWSSGSVKTITWTELGAQRIKIGYSIDNGETWHDINTVDASSGSYQWTLPLIESEKCFVRVSDYDFPQRTDIGDDVFTISKPYVTVTSPNGGESWSTEMNDITWKSDGVKTVKIEYSLDGGFSWNSVAKNVIANIVSYGWHPALVTSQLCLVRVTAEENSSISDISDTVFTLNLATVVDAEKSMAFSLLPVNPNPFNPSTTISFTLPSLGMAILIIYDISGRKVRELASGTLQIGRHSILWDGRDDSGRAVSSGVYFARLTMGKSVAVRKMLLMK